MTDYARILVIGGGVLGASTLYHLTRLGWSDAVLLEKNDLTHGSTWHAAGLCTHFAHNATIMQMRAESIRLYKADLEKDSGMEVDFRQTGALRVTRLTDRLDEFRHVQGLGRFVGHEFQIVTPSEISELYPLAEMYGLIGGVYEPHDGHVDPSQATHAFAAAARSRGARIYRNTPVLTIDRKSSGEWQITAPNKDFRCEHIVNAAGTWCREIGDLMGVDLPVVPVLHQYLVTESIEEIQQRQTYLPIFRDPEESWYTRQERDGLIFGPYEKSPEAWSIDGIPSDFGADLLPPSLDRLGEIIEAATRRIPVLGKVGIKSQVNGPITFTPDANPLIGPAFGLPNAWLITGSSMGVMEGGGAGKFLAEWIEGGEPPMDALAIDSRRFGEYADRTYRVSKAIESFAHQFGIHYPKEERPAGRPQNVSPFFEQLNEAGAVCGAVYGWERPNWFQTEKSGSKAVDSFRRTNWFEAVSKECQTVSEKAGLCDMSAISKFFVAGVDAERFMEVLGSNAPPRKVGQISIIHVLTESGGVLSEFVASRIAEDQYYLTSAAAAARSDFDILCSRALEFRVKIKPVTDEISVLSLAGPFSQKIFGEVTGLRCTQSEFPLFSGSEVMISGVKVRALRLSYTGEAGWELHIPQSESQSVYRALVESGEQFGLGHFGAFAVDSMRLEKGFRAWGLDLTTERTPFEAGLDHLIKTENRQFVGKDALLRRQESREYWRLEQFEIHSTTVDPFYLHPIFQREEVVGIVTSGAYGHRTGKTLALGYLTEKANVEASEFEIEIIGERYKATILGRNPYDSMKNRVQR